MEPILSALNSALNFIYSNVLSIAMLVLLIVVGFFLTIRLRGLQFRRFGYIMKNTLGSLFDKSQHSKDKGSVSPFQAVTTALAGTIGTGSIAGVATALVAGGPGAIFWMWVSALLGMVTKYSEIVLSLKYREKNEAGAWCGGPMYYIKSGLKNKKLAVVFAIFAMIACIGTGNATQSNSIAGVVNGILPTPTEIPAVFSASVSELDKYIGIRTLIISILVGIVLTVLATVVILGGVKRIASINEKLVPIMAVFFILSSVLALLFNVSSIPKAFALIFKEAFTFKSAAGGALGYGIFSAMRYGVGRGVFSNEAGLGSAPIAHAASSTKDPVKQGLWGSFEVFITTIVICTMSALVVLTSDVYMDAFNSGVVPNVNGAALSAAAYGEAIPYVGSIVISVATVFFALSTILGWAYYGEVCATYLFKHHQKKAVLVYRIVYIVFVFVGAVARIDIVWIVADCFNALMALPNLIALTALSWVVVSATKAHFANKKKLTIK